MQRAEPKRHTKRVSAMCVAGKKPQAGRVLMLPISDGVDGNPTIITIILDCIYRGKGRLTWQFRPVQG